MNLKNLSILSVIIFFLSGTCLANESWRSDLNLLTQTTQKKPININLACEQTLKLQKQLLNLGKRGSAIQAFAMADVLTSKKAKVPLSDTELDDLNDFQKEFEIMREKAGPEYNVSANRKDYNDLTAEEKMILGDVLSILKICVVKKIETLGTSKDGSANLKEEKRTKSKSSPPGPDSYTPPVILNPPALDGEIQETTGGAR